MVRLPAGLGIGDTSICTGRHDVLELADDKVQELMSL